MTCIASLSHDGVAYLGADSLGVFCDGQTVQYAEGKVVRLGGGEIIVATCGFRRLNTIIAHAFTAPPLPPDGARHDRYVAVDFVDALRSTLKERGALKSENGLDSLDGSQLLVGLRGGRLYMIDDRLAAIRVASAYYATGSGGQAALAVLHATRDLGLDPVERVTRALDASAFCLDSVAPPYVIESTRDGAERVVVEAARPG